MLKKRRALAMMIAGILALIMLFSVFYIILEADHDCSGEDCAICAVLNACESILHQLIPVSAAVCFWFAAVYAASGTQKLVFCFTGASTLITLKVKLSN